MPFRTARFTVAAMALAALTACGSTSRPVGTSTGGETPTVTTPSDAGAVRIAPDFRTRLKKTGDRFESKGHAPGRWDAQLYVNDAAEQVWLTDTSFPPGAEIVMEHIERQGEKVSGPLMAMKKSESGWTFSVMNSRGDPLTGRALDSCPACHKDAARDDVFAPTR